MLDLTYADRPAIFMNCRKLPFENTLGVARVLLNLVRELQNSFNIVLIADGHNRKLGELACEKWGIRLSGSVDIEGLPKYRQSQNSSLEIELLPHHFQLPELSIPSITICHDLHPFDIPWKYENPERSQQLLRDVCTRSSAVVTHFPRTFVDLEHTINETIPNLFLTDSPLMATSTNWTKPERMETSRGVVSLLYPAQFQPHKNHIRLLNSISRLIAQGIGVQLLLTGSDFADGSSNEILRGFEKLVGDHHIVVHGHVNEEKLAELYRDVDGIVVPSLAEGGAYVALEGIAQGKIVAVNRIRSAEMHLHQYGCDVEWFDADDDDSIDATISRICNGSLANQVTRNSDAVAKIRSTTWTRVAECWVDIINFVLGIGRRPILRTTSTFDFIEYV